MDDILTTLKVGLASQLEKEGSSLEELETALANATPSTINKVAELLVKTAFFGEGLLSGAASGIMGAGGKLLGAIPEMGMTSALMLGSMGGAGVYGLKKHLENQDSEAETKLQEINRIKSLTNRLKDDYGIHSHNK